MRLSDLALRILRGSKDMKEAIIESEQVHMNTVNRWIQFNDDALTKASILAIIKRFTGLTEDQLLEPVSHEPVKV